MKKAKLTEDQRHTIARALADPRRFAMLQQIAAKPCIGCSCLDAHKTISPATISHHIKELQEAGLIEVVYEGRGANLTLRREVWNAYVANLATL